LPDRAAGWWPLLLLFPLGVGILVGWSLRAGQAGPLTRLSSVGVAALVVAAECWVLGQLAGGRLAGGPFDPLTVRPWWLALAALGWIAVPAAAVVCASAGWRPSADGSAGAPDGNGADEKPPAGKRETTRDEDEAPSADSDDSDEPAEDDAGAAGDAGDEDARENDRDALPDGPAN